MGMDSERTLDTCNSETYRWGYNSGGYKIRWVRPFLGTKVHEAAGPSKVGRACTECLYDLKKMCLMVIGVA